MWLLTAFALAAPLLVVHLGTMAVVAAAVGAIVKEVRIFSGPALTLRREKPTIAVGVFPLGGWVSCRGQSEEDAVGEARRFDDLAAWRRVLVFLSGNLALLVVAALVLGPLDALACAGRAPLQLASLAIDRTSALADVRAFSALATLPMLGVVAAKVAAFNLLPLAPLNGWAIVRLAIPASQRTAIERRWTLASSLLMLLLFALGGMTLLRA